MMFDTLASASSRTVSDVVPFEDRVTGKIVTDIELLNAERVAELEKRAKRHLWRNHVVERESGRSHEILPKCWRSGFPSTVR